eukprot:gb/GEZN01000722.1/.p1 GENE.gb/GEZN01000722.1/~~gb/GEZN01000722.1/.p1  ORF type:complete len:1205 (-),score=195.78 gb/GEZN01000722.1/:119-3733(-)
MLTQQQKLTAVGVTVALAGALTVYYFISNKKDAAKEERKQVADRSIPSVPRPLSGLPFTLFAEVTVSRIPIRKFLSHRTGLTVVICQIPGPLVNGYFTLATETWSDDGCPHVLEHLVFLGSEKYPYKGMLDEVANRSLAQGTNAWTDVDHTCYTVTTAGQHGFLQILPAYLDHILYPTLTEAGFITEVHHVDGEGKDAGVVYCEMQGRENSGESRLHLETLRALYPGRCSYKAETGGLLADLRTLQSQTVREYHKQYYRPDNLCLIVAGQVSEEELLSSVARFETERVLPKGSLPAMPGRPFSQDLPPLREPVYQTVQYAAEDEKNGLATIGVRGPKYSQQLESLAMEILINYLNESAISPLQMAFVESEPPLCAMLDISSMEQSEHVYLVEFEGVPKGQTVKLEPELRKVFVQILDTGMDMERMALTIDRYRRNILSRVESSPSRHVDTIIVNFIYGDREDPASFCEVLDVFRTLEVLTEKPPGFWHGLLRAVFLSRPWVVTIGQPSKAYGKAQREAETSRLSRQQASLGPNGLAKLQSDLNLANQTNGIKPPDKLLASFPVPDFSQVPSIPLFTVRARQPLPSPASHPDGPSLLRHLASQPGGAAALNTLPFLSFQLDHISSAFVTLRVFMDTSRVEAELRPYLTLYSEVFFESCVGEYTHEQVIKSLQTDTVDYACTLGLGGEVFGPGSYAEYVVVELKLETCNYSAAISWLQRLLFELRFTPDRLRVTLKRLLNSVPGLKNDAALVLDAVAQQVCFSDSSQLNQHNFLKQQKIMKDILAQLDNPEGTRHVLLMFEKLRIVLTGVESLRVFCACDWMVQPQLVAVWCKEFPAMIAAARSEQQRVANSSLPARRSARTLRGGVRAENKEEEKPSKEEGGKRGEEGKGENFQGDYMVKVAGTESAYLACSVKLGISHHTHPDYPPLKVLISYLTECESPFWKRIRGLGYAYAYSIQSSLERGLLTFRLSRASNLSTAYEQAKEIVNDYATQKTQFKELELDAAKSSTVYGILRQKHTVHSAAEASMLEVLGGEGPESDRLLLKGVASTTQADLLRVLRKYVLRLFQTADSVSVVACDPARAAQLADEMKALQRPPKIFDSAQDFFSQQGVEVVEEDDEEEGDEDEDDDEDEEQDENAKVGESFVMVDPKDAASYQEQQEGVVTDGESADADSDEEDEESDEGPGPTDYEDYELDEEDPLEQQD